MQLRCLAAVFACGSSKTCVTACSHLHLCNLACGPILVMHSCACSDEAMELLRRGWPPGEEPKYDTNHALVLCRMHSFRPGLIFLYEHMRLFREVMQVGVGLNQQFQGGYKGHMSLCIKLRCMHGVCTGLMFLYEHMRLFERSCRWKLGCSGKGVR